MKLERLRWSAAIALLCAAAEGQTTARLNLGLGGTQANGLSGGQVDPNNGSLGIAGLSLSADARYVAFGSIASDLVPGDLNGTWDVFVRDRQAGTTRRVSVGAGGVESNGASYLASISADGRYVAFLSQASNLVPIDTNMKIDVFVRDLQSGTTVLASVSSTGVQGDDDASWLALSANGRYVAWASAATTLVQGDTNVALDIFVRDLQTATTTRVSVDSNGAQANGSSGYWSWPSISSDGRYVAFESDASNLVANDNNGMPDVFVHDLQTGATTRMSESSTGVEGNDWSDDVSISADGRYVAFFSAASTLDPAYNDHGWKIVLRDRQTATTSVVSYGDIPMLAPDGQSVAITYGDPPPQGQLSVWANNFQSGVWTRADVSSSNVGADNHSFCYPNAISTDGRYVAFVSEADNLVAGDSNGVADVFLHDLQTGATTRESVQAAGVQGDKASYGPAFSDGARYVAFASWASNMVLGDTNDKTDVFVRDLQTGSTTRASLSSSGAQASQHCDTAQVSADGRFVAFFSIANNLVPGDTNGTGDVFVRDLLAGTTEFATLDSSGAQIAWAMPGTPVSMSADGRYVAFHGSGPFVPADTNGARDVYVRDRTAATTIRASVGSSGAQGNGDSSLGSISADGRYVVFSSTSSNLVANDTNTVEDVFVRDLALATTTRVSLSSGGVQADGQSLSPSISPDGRYVAFWSDATNLVQGDTNVQFDVFVRDLQTGTTTRESVDSNGVQADGMSFDPSISRDGRYVAFVSYATNLVQGDTNGAIDVFLRDRLTRQTTRVSVSTAGAQGDNHSSANTTPVVSPDGQLVAFDSYATNLVAGDTNGASDVFLRDRGDASVFAPFCFGDGSSGACPCGNQGSPGRGCQNSIGTGGALLTGTGLPSLAADTVHLTSSGELPTATSILLQGTAVVTPVIFGDGLRCTGGPLKRLFTHNATGGSVTYPQGADPTISVRSTAVGAPIPVGGSRFYQVYYRDPNSGFCPNPPGSTYSISSGIAIVWGS